MGVKPLLIHLTDTASGDSFTAVFDESPILIGRGQDVTLQIDRDHVSAHHSSLGFDDQSISYLDLDSRNGTQINGVVMNSGSPIAVDDKTDIRIGSIRLSLSRDERSRPAPGQINPFASAGRPLAKGTSALPKDAIERMRREYMASKAAPPRPTVAPVIPMAKAWARMSGPVPQMRGEPELTEIEASPWARIDSPGARTPTPPLPVRPPEIRAVDVAQAPADFLHLPPLVSPMPATVQLPKEMPLVKAPVQHSPGDTPAFKVAHVEPSPRQVGPLATDTLLAGRFRIASAIGEGGMGVVYRAHDEQMNVPVAIKTLAHSRVLTPEALERFFREAKVIRAVGHPNIVDVRDFGVDGDVPYIAMELLKGEDLGESIDRHALPVPDAVDIMLAVCAGLHAAHEKGLVHRDLKPQNIFLAKAWRAQDVVKILDFGITKTSDSRLTNTGDVMGTEHYLSPEQAQDSNSVDARSDIYALGVILYQCVTQQPPHDGHNVYQVIKNIVEGNVRPLRQFNPDVPDTFAAVVHRAMAMRPEDRFDTAHDLARALLPFSSPRGHRLWSDHFSSLPPVDPLASYPHGQRISGNEQVVQAPVVAQAPQYVAGGTHQPVATPLAGVPASPLDHRREANTRRRVSTVTDIETEPPAPSGSKRIAIVGGTLFAAIATAGAFALYATKGSSPSQVESSALTAPVGAPAPSAFPPAPTASPPTKTVPPEPTAPPITESRPAATTAPPTAELRTAGRSAAAPRAKKVRSKRRHIKYNADGIPLIE